MASFVIGFDEEEPGAGRRITQFLQEACIPAATISMLQALPGTPLWDRLDAEKRLVEPSVPVDPTGPLLNFKPTRSLEQIAHEYTTAVYLAYDPVFYLDRTYRCFRKMGAPVAQPSPSSDFHREWTRLRILARILWRQGVRARTRWKFWRNLTAIAIHNRPQIAHYLTVCAHIEHFSKFRDEVLLRVQHQLTERLSLEHAPPEPSALTAALEAQRERHARDLERMES